MQLAKRIGILVGALGLAGAFSSTAHAQIGSGWSSTSVSYTTQVSSGCYISGGYFRIDGGSGRAERRYTTLTSGSRQFQGTFVMDTLGGDRVAVFQTFSQVNGPKQMGAIKKPGTLYEVQGGATLSSYSIGSSMRINTIASASGSVQVYVNGSQKESMSGVNEPYNKLGAYATASGYGPAEVHWSSIQFWRK
jgi:hypothetical protein